MKLSENDLAKIEVVNIYIALEKPNNEIIYDITKGSGTFTYEKRESFYTIKDEILIDRNEKELTLNYSKNEELEKGKYKVHIYTKDYKLGTGEFLIK